MRTVCDLNMCAGCGACIESCSINAIKIDEQIIAYNAVIDEKLCLNCGKCTSVCPKNNPAPFIEPLVWYQGWSNEAIIREKASSGGVATAISKAFIQNGGVVCTCKFLNGNFNFHFINNEEDLFTAMGSKYVKSNPFNVYKEIKKRINNGEKILFIGLPCQVSAVKNFTKNAKVENLFTVDLICHGTPSPRLLEGYLKQYKVDIKNLSTLNFREKAKFGLTIKNKPFNNGVQDNYITAFLTSLSYTENCYYCDYAQTKRVSDITLGDSWDTDLPNEEKNKGVSLILCQTNQGESLIKSANLSLYPVDIVRAVNANQQLKEPSKKPNKRELFFKKINKGKSLNGTMFLINPKREGKNIIKRILSRIK